MPAVTASRLEPISVTRCILRKAIRASSDRMLNVVDLSQAPGLARAQLSEAPYVPHMGAIVQARLY